MRIAPPCACYHVCLPRGNFLGPRCHLARCRFHRLTISVPCCPASWLTPRRMPRRSPPLSSRRNAPPRVVRRTAPPTPCFAIFRLHSHVGGVRSVHSKTVPTRSAARANTDWPRAGRCVSPSGNLHCVCACSPRAPGGPGAGSSKAHPRSRREFARREVGRSLRMSPRRHATSTRRAWLV